MLSNNADNHISNSIAVDKVSRIWKRFSVHFNRNFKLQLGNWSWICAQFLGDVTVHNGYRGISWRWHKVPFKWKLAWKDFFNDTGYDGFFVLTTLNCIAKLSVCSHHVSKIGDFSDFYLSTEMAQEALIDKCVKYHLKALSLIATSNSLIELTNVVQIVTTFGMVVIMSFQLHLEGGVSYILCLELFVAIFQLFLFCFLCECVTDAVNFIFYEMWSPFS